MFIASLLEGELNKNDAGDDTKVILTTNDSVMAVSKFKTCFVIMTCTPTDLSEYLQIVGKSNRVDFRLQRHAALIIRDSVLT